MFIRCFSMFSMFFNVFQQENDKIPCDNKPDTYGAPNDLLDLDRCRTKFNFDSGRPKSLG